MFTSAILKITWPTAYNCCNKEKDVAAKCCTWSAVGQSLMVSVCQSISQNWSTEVWYLLKIKSNESDITQHTHTHPYNGLWILLKQETVSGSGISWTICKSAPSSRQTTMPAPHHSVFTGRMPFLHQTNSVKAITQQCLNIKTCSSYLCYI